MFHLLTALVLLLFTSLNADEIRPAYVEIEEKSPKSFSVLLKVPAKDNKRLSLDVKFPSICKATTQREAHFFNNSYLQRWQIKCSESLANKTIRIEGLNSTNTDLLLRLEQLDASSQTQILKPAEPFYTVLKSPSSLQVAQTYTWLGITHILMGYDHLMFVFALLLIVKNIRRLLITITAFTLAHSITLVGATLGFVHIPQAPVEVVIALSILFLAVEIMKEKVDAEPSITARYPWVVAFTFGLLHGFGFAGALSEVGIPENAISIALIFFNIGVELGQLLFVSLVVIVGLLLKSLKPSLMQKLQTAVVYTIGGISSFWLFERMSGF